MVKMRSRHPLLIDGVPQTEFDTNEQHARQLEQSKLAEREPEPLPTALAEDSSVSPVSVEVQTSAPAASEPADLQPLLSAAMPTGEVAAPQSTSTPVAKQKKVK